ncbi:MAG: ribonuclease III [Coriobacteriia bacterium]|nr:ribonuclease III [Coriobacteriia bacterium]
MARPLPESNLSERLAQAEKILGHQFSNPTLLETALRHPSAASEDSSQPSYDRLEFLGDAVLGMVVSRLIYDRFPRMDEGGMTRIKVSLVAGQQLSEVAKGLGFGELISFGSSERGTGNRGLTSALEDIYEACIAALTLDGGLEVATAFIERTLAPLIQESMAAEPTNPKSTLQEILQVRHITPTYEVIDTEGPPHSRTFTVTVLADGEVIGQGSGRSKKDAEAAAALSALKKRRR